MITCDPPIADSPAEAPSRARASGRRLIIKWAAALAAIAALVLLANRSFEDPKAARAAIIAGVCLIFWLSELIPLYATTLVLWAGIVLLLGPLDPKHFAMPQVLSAAASPVMALFFGGFVLSVAGARYGIDGYIAGWMVQASRRRRRLLLFWVMQSRTNHVSWCVKN